MTRRCCCVGDPDCCGCSSCRNLSISYIQVGGVTNATPVLTGGPCVFQITNMPDEPATATFKKDDANPYPIWEVLYKGVTYKTGQLTTCSGAADFTSGNFDAIAYSGTPCSGKCCTPGQTLRVVSSGEVVATFNSDVLEYGLRSVAGGRYCPPSTQCPSCQKCDQIRRAINNENGFASLSGTYPAKLIDTNTGQEVSQQDLDDALAKDLTSLANCQMYASWQWEFYRVDTTIGTSSQLDKDSWQNCDAGCAASPPNTPTGGSVNYRLELGTPQYGRPNPNPPFGILKGRSGSVLSFPGDPITAPSGDQIIGPENCRATWATPVSNDGNFPGKDPSSTGEWHNVVPFIQCLPPITKPLGATFYFRGKNMFASRNFLGAWANQCCNCGAVYTFEFLDEILEADFRQNWTFTDSVISCT